ncbi:MAG TPA: type II toxin-antitoxin system mRNA interferase toxin, RelE/StbE family [Candidatus Paceibacterota bacterium]|jgi:addiction module RelE/StbE family toxin|nr:type II toxin-antitoxin system mRNA interferase toxin, RelE/StbE family [Candidatus Paceibacterota bacterium]
MTVAYSRIFKKMFKKKNAWVQNKFGERLSLFMKDRNNPTLNNHPLGGIWAGCRSINITGDFRAVYEELGDDQFQFIAIGTHSELYT